MRNILRKGEKTNMGQNAMPWAGTKLGYLGPGS